MHVKYSYMRADVSATQTRLEAASAALVESIDKLTASNSSVNITEVYTRNAEGVVAAWWTLPDSLIEKFSDGCVRAFIICRHVLHGTLIVSPVHPLQPSLPHTVPPAHRVRNHSTRPTKSIHPVLLCFLALIRRRIHGVQVQHDDGKQHSIPRLMAQRDELC